MDTMDTQGLIGAVGAVTAALAEKKDWLCELDGVIGDGDHGVTLEVGFKAASASLAGLGPEATPTEVFNQAAKSFLNAMGGSSGPLYATAFMRAGASVKGQTAIDAAGMAGIIAGMAEGIQARGKAEPGDKTMLDAWLPARDAAQAAVGDGLAGVLAAAAQAAADGAEATKQLEARKGRASRLGERSVGHADPGASSTAIILATLAAHVGGQAAAASGT